MNGKTMFKNTADQAMASWVTYLNQLRIDALFEKLTIQDMNLSEMLKILDCLKLDIAELVESNRGGEKGIHGFIGERLQVGLSNAKNIIDGIKPTYKLIDDNGRDDFLNGSIPIQLKCVQKNCGLDAIKKHLETYPNFLKNGGKYQIPKDYYNRLNTLWSLPEEDVGRLGRADLRLYRNIQKFFNETGLHKSDIEPMEVDYSEVQKGTYNQTINNKERDYRSKDAENRNKAYETSKPSMKEAGVITGVSAGIEGGIEFCLAILKKYKEGKKINEFTKDDWKDVGIDTVKSTVKGGIRGGAVYVMSNFTATPSNVASALVTSVFGMMSNAAKLREGKITNEEFILNSQICCIESAISALSGLIGQIAIPIPILGTVIGSVIGNTMYKIAVEYCDEKEQSLISLYCNELNDYNKQLEEKYRNFVEDIERRFNEFATIADLAFDDDINKAFDYSIRLAKVVGVDENKILDSIEKIDSYFMN